MRGLGKSMMGAGVPMRVGVEMVMRVVLLLVPWTVERWRQPPVGISSASG